MREKVISVMLCFCLVFTLITSNVFAAQMTNKQGSSIKKTESSIKKDGKRAKDTLPAKILVGYWHNFVNAAGYIKLRDVSPKWDVINVAFAETAGDRCTVQFIPDRQSEAELKADIAYLKGHGKKVVLSIGGQNASVSLPDNAAKQKFVDSMIAIIDKYGFDGLDLDIETGVSLAPGDTDFKNPKTPMIVNLIAATRAICEHYGPGFVLSMAPEVAYVQGGITAYATNWGAYLPIIHALRDKLTYLHVQHYNCGGNTALDGRTYNQGTADFEVAMAEMLLNGFPVGGNPNNIFPALREDQVMIGLPACSAAAPSGGYISPGEMKKALDYIIKGSGFGGSYKLAKPSGYSGFRGLMAWSVNWDANSGYEFTNNYRSYFGGPQPPVVKPPAVPEGLTAVAAGANEIDVSWKEAAEATNYDLEIDGVVKNDIGNSFKHTGLSANSTHKYRVRAKNTAGVSQWSAVITATTQSTNPVKPPVPTGLAVKTISSSQLDVSWNAKSAKYNYDLEIDGVVKKDVTSPYSQTGLAPNSTHNFKVRAKNSAGESVWSETVVGKTLPSGGQSSEWQVGKSYTAGDVVTYGGKTYRCRQAHTTIAGWEPPAVPALWEEINYKKRNNK